MALISSPAGTGAVGPTFWKATDLLMVWLGQAKSQLWLLGEAEEMVDSHGEYEVLILR